MIINHNLTETDIKYFDIKSPLEHQIQQQEMKDSGWRFDKISSMTINFYQTGIMNGSNYVKTPSFLTSLTLSNESQFYWKNHKNPVFFRICADFEADKEIDNSSVGHKRTNIYKQNPVLDVFYIESELKGVLKSGYFESPLS